MQLDDIDCQILDALQQDGRIRNNALSALVGLSASACHDRVKRLEALGIVRGYRALIDAGALGDLLRQHTQRVVSRSEKRRGAGRGRFGPRPPFDSTLLASRPPSNFGSGLVAERLF